MLFPPRISTKQLAQFSRRAGTALQAGVDVRTVLRHEAERGSAPQRRVMSQIRDQVAKGTALAEAFRSQETFFPPLVLAMVEVSETSGKLAEGFLQLADHYDHRVTLRRLFWLGIAWPLAELAIAVCVVGFLIWIVGVIGDYTGRTIDLLGLGLVGTEGLIIYLLLVGGVIALITFVVISATRQARWTRPFANAAMRVPVFGRALRTVALARFAWALGMTLDTAMDTRRAIRLAFASTASDFFTRHSEQAERDVEACKDLSGVLRATGVFPDDFLDTLEVGEQSGRVSESMAALAEQYEQKARGALAALTALAGTAVVVLIFALIIAVIFRLALFYIGTINAAASGQF